jgi:hypothetical protein
VIAAMLADWQRVAVLPVTDGQQQDQRGCTREGDGGSSGPAEINSSCSLQEQVLGNARVLCRAAVVELQVMTI